MNIPIALVNIIIRNIGDLVKIEKRKLHQELLVTILRSKWRNVHVEFYTSEWLLYESVGRRNLNLDLPDIWNYQFADILPALQDRNSGTILYHNS